MKSKIFFTTIPIVSFLGLLYFLSFLGLINNFLLPLPHIVVTELGTMLVKKKLIIDVFFTLQRTLYGFTFACILGIPLGLMMGYINHIYFIFEFPIDFLRNIPATALFPLFILLYGIGESSKIAVATWVASLILIFNSFSGVQNSKKIRLRAARFYQTNNLILFKRIILPEALPQIIIGMRLAYSFALIIIIVAEMTIGTNYGLGKRIVDAQLLYKTSEMYAVILLTGLLGYGMNKIFLYLEKRIIFWRN